MIRKLLAISLAIVLVACHPRAETLTPEQVKALMDQQEVIQFDPEHPDGRNLYERLPG